MSSSRREQWEQLVFKEAGLKPEELTMITPELIPLEVVYNENKVTS
jgi:hypothetical protein